MKVVRLFSNLGKLGKLFMRRTIPMTPPVRLADEWRDRLDFLPVADLHRRLGFAEPFIQPECSRSKTLLQWRMQLDDEPILRYLFRNLKPRRHLEFGTWQGEGVCACLESCNATVWTLNLPDGELREDGSWAYSSEFAESDATPPNSRWVPGRQQGYRCHQTDAGGFIGRFYRERGLGARVCQVFCDSRHWDVSNYPSDFFDTCLIDGGHVHDVVVSDTRKALSVVRSGGLIAWHDFCPDRDVLTHCWSPRGVLSGLLADWPRLRPQLRDVFWIMPSWLLVGIRK
jgi:hypothetical protein